MKSQLATVALLLLMTNSLIGQGQDSLSVNEIEPPLRLELTIDGKTYTLKDGDELKLKGVAANPTVSVRSAAFRQFQFESVYFEYPTHFAYTYEEDFGYRIWSLDGSDFIILMFVYDVPVVLDELVDEMVAQFGAENCTITPFERKLGEIPCIGKKIEVSLIGQSLNYEILDIPFPDDKKRILAFQDIRDETGNSSPESMLTMQQINTSFKLIK
ncbi:MAG: hypothetical protein HUU34_22120 [Saprospiraceae bacterium]|nr:hypothetical protein [Saprospiraceae bacterium]